MATYDSAGIFYDGPTVFYDAAPAPVRRTMAKVKLELKDLTPDELVTRATQIKNAMTGNANFTTPNPSLASVGTLITAAGSKVTAQKAAVLAAKQATDDRDAACEALKTALRSLADYVSNISSGDAVIIQSAGMEVKSATQPVGVLAQVRNLSATAGDNEGELDLTWDPVRGAKSYQVQWSPDPITATSWKDASSPAGKSKKAVKDLTSGARTWVRVRAISGKDENNGPWSDPAVKVVP
jgi:hypothetical protein